MIHPQYGVNVARSRTSALWHLPHVFVSAARRHSVVRFVRAGSSVIVGGSLRVLLVEDAVSVNGIGFVAVIAEHDPNGVSHLGASGRGNRGAPTPWGAASAFETYCPCTLGTTFSRRTCGLASRPVPRPAPDRP